MTWLQKNCVIVPIDFSEASWSALEPALEFVQNPSKIHIIHTLSTLHPADPAMIWNTMDDDTRKKHVKDAFDKKLNELNYQGIQTSVVFGDPSSQIIDYAKEHHADLVVMSSHGRTGIGRFMMGSVAERVVRLSHCPVLVIR